jgi:hypothetical protein
MRRIWQAIINEAVFRSYSVRLAHNRREVYDRGKLIVEIGQDEFPLELYGDPKVPLRLRIAERHPSRRRGYDTWTDTPERPLHKSLGEVFTHIERWADLLINQRAEQERRANEERRRRDELIAEASRQFAEDHRRNVIEQRLADVRFADDARAYSDALDAAAANLGLPRADEVRAWASWARDHADRVDPRRTLTGTPAVPKPNRDDLERYPPASVHWYL